MASTSALGVLLAALAYSPSEDIVRDHVDLVEVNHYFDEYGRHVFDQTIYYDWCPVQCRYNVRAWRLVKSQSQLPHRDWESGGYVATWHDGSILRKIRADSLRESWTQYDPELIEQEYLPKDKRRELQKPGALSQQLGLGALRDARCTAASSPDTAATGTQTR